MDYIFISIIVQIINTYNTWLRGNADRRKVLRMKRALIEKRRRSNRMILAFILRRRRRRLFQRSCWVQPELVLCEHGKFWETAIPNYNDERFQKKFRLNRATFGTLCNTLRPYLLKHDTRMREAIVLEKRVAVALTFLKGNCDFWSIADLYGIGKSTVGCLLYEFCDAVLAHYYDDVIKFPDTDEERLAISRGFVNRWQFPDCFGAMDGTHIPILAPADYPEDYYNYKSFHSIVALCVVDYKYQFTYINIGAPGRCNDASIFRRSALFKKFSVNNETHNGQRTNLHIISDAAFPLLTWLLKPYPITNEMSLMNRNFNYRLSSARMTVENAFGRLKGRWRILLKRADLNLENMKRVAKVCFVLHNICESHNQIFHSEWLDKVRAEESRMANVPSIPVPDNRAPTLAKIKRDRIAERLMNDGVSTIDC